jgi:hypothetical protein
MPVELHATSPDQVAFHWPVGDCPMGGCHVPDRRWRYGVEKDSRHADRRLAHRA